MSFQAIIPQKLENAFQVTVLKSQASADSAK